MSWWHHAQNVIVSGGHISTFKDLLSEDSLSFTSWRRSLWTEDLWPFKIHIWNLITKTKIFGGEAFGRQLGHEGEAFMNGISALARGDMREMLSPSLSTTWEHGQKAAATAAKLLQSCPILCDPINGSPPGSPVPEILQARTLEWIAISFSNAWKWKVKVKSLSHVHL